MKIALIAHLKFPIAEPFAGGLEMHSHMLARKLLERGHELTLFAAEGSDPRLGFIPLMPPTGTPCGAAEEAAAARAEQRAYADILGRLARGSFDVVHNNALHWLPLIAGDPHGPPMVTVLHTPPFKPLERAVRTRALDDMTFVAISPAVARMWGNIVVSDAVIANGIALDRFAYGAGTAGGGHAIWSGRIVPEKGLHHAIAAARRSGLQLRIAGPRPNPQYWNSVVAPLLGREARYIGHLGHEELAREVAGASVALVTPCFDEPFGMVVAEALACGTPVAGFARGALPDLLDVATGRLAAPGDDEGLAQAMLAARALRRTACRDRAERLWNVETMVDRYESLYGQMLVSAARKQAIAA